MTMAKIVTSTLKGIGQVAFLVGAYQSIWGTWSGVGIAGVVWGASFVAALIPAVVSHVRAELAKS